MRFVLRSKKHEDSVVLQRDVPAPMTYTLTCEGDVTATLRIPMRVVLRGTVFNRRVELHLPPRD